jgi:DNA-binding response OmpR family regulator
MVSTDAEWVSGLQRFAPPTLALLPVETLAQARQHVLDHSPEIVLIDIASLSPGDESLTSLVPLLQACAQLPVIVTTSSDSFEERRQIARHCSCSFLPRDTLSSEILAVIQETLRRRCPATIRVLAVDDDPLILNALTRQLPAWGIQVTPLEDPRQLWQCLLTLRPDVLLLDIEMPDIDGIELCQIIRSDSRWSGLPIVFLSGRRDAETIQRLYSAGADDYIPKPFTEPELVTRIINRLERTHPRQQHPWPHHPAVLVPAQQAISDLERGLLLAQRYQQCYCLGLIYWTVDGESSVPMPLHQNAQWLSRLGDMLKRNLRQEDIVTQFYPATVTVGLYGVSEPDATTRFDSLLERLNEAMASVGEQSEVTVRFRYQCAIAPENGSTLVELRRVAEQGIAQAKIQQ